MYISIAIFTELGQLDDSTNQCLGAIARRGRLTDSQLWFTDTYRYMQMFVGRCMRCVSSLFFGWQIWGKCKKSETCVSFIMVINIGCGILSTSFIGSSLATELNQHAVFGHMSQTPEPPEKSKDRFPTPCGADMANLDVCCDSEVGCPHPMDLRRFDRFLLTSSWPKHSCSVVFSESDSTKLCQTSCWDCHRAVS